MNAVRHRCGLAAVRRAVRARGRGSSAVGPLVAAAGLALPGLTLPGVVGWQARLLMLTGMVTAVLAAVRRTAPMVTATAVQLLALTAIGVLARHPPGSVGLACAGAVMLSGYLLAADLSTLGWPRAGLARRIWPLGLVVLGATGAVSAASVLPTAASPVAVLAGLAGVVAGYALAVGRRPGRESGRPDRGIGASSLADDEHRAGGVPADALDDRAEQPVADR